MSNLLEIVSRSVRPLAAYAPPKQRRSVILDANESPWPLSDDALARVQQRVGAIAFHRYPDARASAVRAMLPERHGGTPDDYVLGSGSDEVIALMITALGNPRAGSQQPVVLFPTPTFVMFGMTSVVHGAKPVGIPLDNHWDLDVPKMRAAMDEHRPNLVFLATPNNPTGNRFSEDRIRTLIQHAPNTLFVIDEAYAPFARASLRHLADEYENVSMMGTLSKVGLAAIRFGWARLPSELAVEVDKARQPYNGNSLTQTVAELALGELAEELDAGVLKVVAERERVVNGLKAAGLRTFPTEANFVLLDPGEEGDAWKNAWSSAGVDVRSFTDGRLAGYVRITIGTPDENERLLSVSLP